MGEVDPLVLVIIAMALNVLALLLLTTTLRR